MASSLGYEGPRTRSRAHFDLGPLQIRSAIATLSAPPAAQLRHTYSMDTSGGRSASGTSPWPYMPTRGPRRPACPSNGLVVGRRVRKAGRRVRKRGYVVSRGSAPRSRVIGDAPQLYTQQSGGCRARGSGNRATKRARSNYPPTEALTELRTIATSSRDSDPHRCSAIHTQRLACFPTSPFTDWSSNSSRPLATTSRPQPATHRNPLERRALARALEQQHEPTKRSSSSNNTSPSWAGNTLDGRSADFLTRC